MTEGDVLDLLRVRYPKESCALLPQVADRTGSARRYADAIVMNLWKSRGMALEGFEIKVRRNDWLRELKKPSKADTFYRFCNYWWVVAPGDVVQADEVPEPWGFLEVKGSSLRVAKRAPKNRDAEHPTRDFLAAMLRRLQQHEVPDAVLDAKYQEGYTAGSLHARNHAACDIESAKSAYEELRDAVAEFELASGVKIKHWRESPRQIGEAVDAVLNRKLALRQAQRATSTAVRNVEDTLSLLKTLSTRLASDLENVQ